MTTQKRSPSENAWRQARNDKIWGLFIAFFLGYFISQREWAWATIEALVLIATAVSVAMNTAKARRLEREERDQ